MRLQPACTLATATKTRLLPRQLQHVPQQFTRQKGCTCTTPGSLCAKMHASFERPQLQAACQCAAQLQANSRTGAQLATGCKGPTCTRSTSTTASTVDTLAVSSSPASARPLFFAQSWAPWQTRRAPSTSAFAVCEHLYAVSLRWPCPLARVAPVTSKGQRGRAISCRGLCNCNACCCRRADGSPIR